jgi:hypothetical protein
MPLFNRASRQTSTVYKVYHVRIIKHPLRERIPRVSPVWWLMAAGFVASVAARRLLRSEDDDAEGPPPPFP